MHMEILLYGSTCNQERLKLNKLKKNDTDDKCQALWLNCFAINVRREAFTTLQKASALLMDINRLWLGPHRWAIAEGAWILPFVPEISHPVNRCFLAFTALWFLYLENRGHFVSLIPCQSRGSRAVLNFGERSGLLWGLCKPPAAAFAVWLDAENRGAF